ncbi:CHASE domain-containing protein [Motiliproteus sp. MSK22-1]|uniref:CHASE domain-containing protein n=1 Tax=Motiliproteus sp. MSK22-1 TaxID=1897630 RepID=UPI000976F18A|nr:CHASE domain-containing protein [Motiliproteus sp. MSK22-1]OMH26257.1 hypothetical protein BGP75_01100 [Motiliproteus sp. MSK22-1]
MRLTPVTKLGRWLRKNSPLAGFILSIGLTLLAWKLALHNEKHHTKSELEYHSSYIVLALERTLAASVGAVRTLEGKVHFNSLRTQDEFKFITERILNRYPGLHAIAWAPRINPDSGPSNQLNTSTELSTPTELSASIDSQDSAAFKSKDSFPVFYTVPHLKDSNLVGSDLALKPSHQRAIEQARDTDSPIATGPIDLDGKTNGQKAILLFVPVYQPNQTIETIDQRRQHLLGFTLGVFQLERLIETALAGDAGKSEVHLRITDRDTEGEQLLYSTDHQAHGTEHAVQQNQTGDVYHHHLSVGGRNWEMEFHPRNHESSSHWLQLPLLLLIAGLLASCVIYLYLRSLINRTETYQKYVTEQARREDSELFSSSILKTVRDGVITVDSRGIIHSCNPATESIFGYKTDQLIGQKINILMPERYAEHHDDYMNRYLQTPGAKLLGSSRELEALHHDGSEFPIEIRLTKVYIQKELFFTAVVRDITERKRAENLLLEEKNASEAASRAKSAFLAAMSHEIRTPMNGVIGMVEMLGTTQMSPNQNELLATIRSSSFALLHIIEDILDFSKIEAGRLEMERVAVDLISVVEETVDTMAETARKKGVELLMFCDPELHEVYADPVRLRQVLLHLISNGIKFSSSEQQKESRVVISVELLYRKSGKQVVMFRVEDNGVGMTEASQKLLFQPFMQAEASTTRRFGGSGLGLTICQRLLDAMGGTISIDSSEGNGAIFSCRIPFEEVLTVDQKNQFDLSGLKVLLASQDQQMASYMKRYLESAGAQVRLVAKEEDPLKLAAIDSTGPVPLLMVDDKSIDIQAMKNHCNKDSTLKNLRFIILSRNTEQRMHFQDRSATLDITSLHRSDLLHITGVVAGRLSLNADPEDKKTLLQSSELPAQHASNASQRRILVAEDHKTNQKVIRHQLEQLGYNVEVADNGREALLRWKSEVYDLLLTDCHMPEMDGYELARTIRNEESERQLVPIPIIAITADALKGTAQLCNKAGMDDYLTKPIRIKDLQVVMTHWLPLTETADKSNTADPSDTAPIKTADIIDASALESVLGTSDPSILAEFYRDFVCNGEGNLNEILNAYQKGDFQTFGSLCHKLKGSARSVGAHALASCCQELESESAGKESRQLDALVSQLSQHFDAVKQWQQRTNSS